LRVERSQDNAEKLATEFVLKTLKKRLFSSPTAFLTTLDQHEKSLRQAKRGKAVRKPSIGILKQELDRIDEDYAGKAVRKPSIGILKQELDRIDEDYADEVVERREALTAFPLRPRRRLSWPHGTPA
jgi:hypothetical protein